MTAFTTAPTALPLARGSTRRAVSPRYRPRTTARPPVSARLSAPRADRSSLDGLNDDNDKTEVDKQGGNTDGDVDGGEEEDNSFVINPELLKDIGLSNHDGDDGADWDSLQSDETHVVVDASEISHLIEELQRTGRDTMGESSGLTGDLLNLAEAHADARDGVASAVPAPDASSRSSAESGGAASARVADVPVAGVGSMEYFTDENVALMPSWAADMYASNTHVELEEGASRLMPETTRRRLHDIVAARGLGNGTSVATEVASDAMATDEAMVPDGTSAEEAAGMAAAEADLGPAGRGSAPGGLVDCRVRDVADDYHVPEEFVVDAMLSLGVPAPIESRQSVRDSMTGDEIERLLRLISSFDATDLAERYSDRTIAEVADDYDLQPEQLLAVCKHEGLYVHAGAQSRLSVVREDRVLDILLKDEPMGKPYPALLEGLEEVQSD